MRTLATGSNPTGVTASPTKDEVYVVNTDSGTVSVIDAASNRIAGNISVGRAAAHDFVTADGKTGWVANAGSNTATALDLDAHRVIGHVAVGKQPAVARVSGDGKFVAVANRGDDSVTLIDGDDHAGSRHAACMQGAGFIGHSAGCFQGRRRLLRLAAGGDGEPEERQSSRRCSRWAERRWTWR